MKCLVIAIALALTGCKSWEEKAAALIASVCPCGALNVVKYGQDFTRRFLTERGQHLPLSTTMLRGMLR